MNGVRRHSPTTIARNSRTLRWTIVLGLVAMVAVGLVLLFLLTQATTNRELYERNYTRLFIVNLVVASLREGEGKKKREGRKMVRQKE